MAASKSVPPYHLEFVPRDGDPSEAEILDTCEEVDAGVVLIEEYAHQLIEQHRGGELHLMHVESKRCVAHRPVWLPGEDPCPEWVAWQQHPLLPKL